MTRRIPRFVWIAVVLGAVLFLWIFEPWRGVTERARTAAEGLRDSSVYVAPGAPGFVDPDRARRVVGDRAIVVAVFDDTPLTEYADESLPGQALCREIAELLPTNVVMVFATEPGEGYSSSHCVGPNFPEPTLTDISADGFALSVLAAAEASWQYRETETELTSRIEEYVLSFDTEAVEAYGELPRRGPVSNLVDASQLVLAFLGIVAVTIAVFVVLRHCGRFLARSGGVHAPREAELSTRLNALADRLMDPAGTPNAEAAKEYVLALRQLRDARHRDQLDALEQRIERIEELLA